MIDTSKIIHAPVGGGRYTVTAPIVKEDYGLYLKIEGLELPSTYEVDFSNSEHNGTSVTMIGNADGVLIPSQFISSGKDVFAFLYHVGADFGRTVYKFRIPNKLRPDRTDEQPTPTQQSVIDQAISALNEAVEQTAQDVIDADASAQSASESAEQAESAKGVAQNYAQDAQTSATYASQSESNAQASATASANSASQSAQIKDDVEGMVDDAQGYASASAQSASASANSASQASASATSASQSATSAQGYASQAQTSAQTASAKASEASTSAQTASQKATEASQSASLALTYKTDAESAKTASQTAQGFAESARDSAISAQESAEDARDEAQSIVDGISEKVEQIDQNTADIASLEEDIYKPYAVDSASGSIASFPDGADDIPLKSLIVNIDPVQDTSSGDPSPENICPITGHTGFNLYRTGGNLFCKTLPEDAVVCGPLSTGDTTIQSGSLYRAYCVYVGKNTVIRYKKEGTSSFTVGLAFADEYITEREGSVIYDALNMANRNNNTLNSGEHPYLVIVVAKSSVNDQAFNKRGAQIFFKTDDGDPIEYSPTRNIDKYLYDWTEDAGTVYGCTLDILTGVLSVGMLYKQVSSEFLSSRSSDYIGYTASVTALSNSPAVWVRDLFSGAKARQSGGIKALCNAFPILMNSTAVSSSQDRTVFAVDGTSIASVADFISAVQTLEANGDGLWVAYELNAPIEVQLDSHDIASILGGNQIWTDNGTIDVEYRADTKLYIERLTAPDSADMIADSNIVSGQYFMAGNNLYKATANIASGGQVIVGTNAIRKSLSEALNEINA